MKKVLLNCALLLVIVAGCASEEQENLETYVNDDMEEAGSLEQEAVSAYDSVAGDNFQDDETMYNALTETAIPKYQEFVDEIEDLDIEDEEIVDVHDIYIDAANKQLEGFQMTAEALKAQDRDQIDEANKTLEEGYQGIQEYRSSLKDLAEERDVELELGEITEPDFNDETALDANNDENEDTTSVDTNNNDGGANNDDNADSNVNGEQQEALLSYLNDDMESAAALEQEYLADYAEVSGANYTDDETLHTALEESVIPKQEEILEQVKDFDIEDEAIADAHEAYIEAAQVQHEGFQQVMEALEEQDEDLVEKANDKLMEGNEKMNDYQAELKALADERNVELQ